MSDIVAGLTAEQVTNFYLYGQALAPENMADPALLRSADASTSISVDKNDYMVNGAGRFASPAFFDLIKQFFSSSGIPARTEPYTKEEINDYLGLDKIYITQQQWAYSDSKDDYAERVYIWNSVAFKIADSTRFVVKENGERYLTGFAIVPHSFKGDVENFDFQSDDIVAGVGNSYLDSIIDPSGIGRTLNISFSGDRNTISNYSYDDFLHDDATKISPDASLLIGLKNDIDALTDKLFAAGSTRFLQDGKPIIYGDANSNVMEGDIANYDAIDFHLSSHRQLGQYVKNGIVYVAGDGNDSINATQNNDILLGGNGSDTLNGNAGNDILEGGGGADILNPGTGFDRLNGGAGNDTYQINSDFGNVIISGDTDGGTISLLSGTTFRRSGSGEANQNGLYVATDQNGKWLNGKEGWSVSVTGSIATVYIKDNDKNLHTIVIENFDIKNAAGTFGIQFAKSIVPSAAEQTSVLNVVDGRDWVQQKNEQSEVDPFENRSLNYNAANFLYHHGAEFDSEGKVSKPAESDEVISYVFDGNNKADVLNGSDWLSTQQVGFDPAKANDYMQLHHINGTSLTDSAGWIGDILNGYDGDDIITGDGKKTGDSGYDSVGDRDALMGGKGSDTIYGGAGDDYIFAWQAFTTSTFGSERWLDYDHEKYGSVQEALYNNAITIEDIDEKNFIDGGSGNDVIAGASYNDTIDGGNGGDYIMAGAGRDVVLGGDDADVIYGDSFYMQSTNGFIMRDFIAPDVLPGEVVGQGFYSRAYFYRKNQNMNDLFNPYEDYNDIVDGGAGADIIFGEIGDDIISGGTDDDVLFGDRTYSAGYFQGTATGFQKLSSQYHGDDAVDGGEGNDAIIGGGGNDYLVGGEGNDTIYGDVSATIYDKKASVTIRGDEADAIRASDAGWWGKDFILGGQGNDLLVGEGNDDTLDGGDGDDQLYGDWTPEQTEAFDNAAAHTGNDTLTGGNGNDQLMGNSGDDILDGGAGDDLLFGDSYRNGGIYTGMGNDQLTGGAGNDALYGGAGVDTLDGGTGNDLLKGGLDNDVYVIGAGGGVDIIEDIDGQSTLYLSSKPVKTFIQNGNAIIYLSEDGSNRVQMNVPTFMAIKKVYVNDQSFDLEITVSDTQTNYVHGTGSNDTYVISDQYTGSIVLNDAVGNNVLELGDGWFNNTSLTVNSSPNGIYSVKNNSNPLSSLKISESSWVALDEIRLASGEVANLYIEGDSSNNQIHGLGGDDVLDGGDGNDTLYGEAGNDTLLGGVGIDTLIGGSGDDTLKGGSGSNDNLKGGDGNDTLYISTANEGDWVDGEAGDDIFIAEDNAQSWNVHGGSGADTFTINAANYSYYNITDENFDVGDVIQLNVNSDSVNVFSDGITILTADKLSVSHSALRFLTGIDKEALWERMQNLTIRFADGEIWDVDDIKNHSSAGSMFDDEIVGDASANTLHGYAGNDVIYGVDGNDALYGDEGNDQLSGGAGNDVLVGGVGEDWLSGGAGNDTFHFGAGQDSDFIDESALGGWAADADVIQLNGSPSDMSLSRSDLDLVIAMTTGETMTLKSFFANDITHERNLSIHFSGGIQWDTARIQQEIFRKDSGSSYSIIGTSAANTLNGSTSQTRNEYFFGDAGSDTIDGKSGNDWIDGGAGNDILTGGSGSDTFRFGVGSGQDVIKDNAAAIVSDRVRLDFTIGISDLTVEVLSSTNELKIGRHDAAGAVIDSVQVNKALGHLVDIQSADLMVGDSSLLNIINGQMANRTITMTSNTTEDRYIVFSAVDLLGNNLSDAEKFRWKIASATPQTDNFGIDSSNLDGDINNTESAFFFIDESWGSDVNYIAFLPSENAGNASFQFTLQRDDGLTLISSMEVNIQSGSLIGTGGNDIVDGGQTDTALAINALAGDDLVRDGYGNDVIHGGDGNDVLTHNWQGNGDDVFYGDAGNDTLDAGWGADTMVGGSGNDLYIEGNLWSGDYTTIDNSTAALGDVDTLQIGREGYGTWDYRSLWFTQDGDDLLVNQLDALEPGQIRIKSWFDAATPEAKLDVIRVQQDDGNVYEMHVDLHFDVLVQAMAGFAPPASVGAIDSSLNDEYQAAWMLATPLAA